MLRLTILLTIASGWLAAQPAGDSVCARCHPAQTRRFRQTGMGQSMTDPAAAGFKTHAGLPYRIVSRGGRVFQETLRGSDVLESHELLYAIGSGKHGKSALVARGDQLFLAPLSYYTSQG